MKLDTNLWSYINVLAIVEYKMKLCVHTTGASLTMALPVIRNDRFMGVVGLDLNVRHMWAQHNLGLYNYIFAIGPEGIVVSHPLFITFSDYDEHPILLNIEHIEKEATNAGIIAAMKR